MPKHTDAKKKKLSEDKEESLIGHVRQNPVLFTIKHERYYDTKLKAGIWQTIAGLLEEEKNIVQSSWDSIKAKYKREKKKVAEAARVKELYEPNWNHFSSLQFLDEAYLPQATASNLDSLFTDKPNTVEAMEKPTLDKPTLDLIHKILTPVSSGSPTRRGNRLSTRATADNEDLIFFNSLLDHVSKVPDDKKLAMRNEIQDTIMKYAYVKPGEAECNCSALNCSTMGQRHATASTPLHNIQQTFDTIKKERSNKRVKVELQYESDDSDIEYVGHVIPEKKVIPRALNKKTSKKQGQGLPAAAPPLLQMDPSQRLFQQMMLQQQQQYQMLQNLCNFGTGPISTAVSATTASSPTDLQDNQKTPQTGVNSKEDELEKQT